MLMKKILAFFQPQSLRDVILHLLIILSLGGILVILFFYVYLPSYTRQGETVEVPDLRGKNLQDLQTYLEDKDLNYQVQDSTYNPELDPLTVFLQHPEPGSKVKAGRKVFVSIASAKPPEVEMPDLVGRSVINAEDELNSFGLKVDSINYVPDVQQNAVLKQLYKGQPIKPGEKIRKGEKISLVVGDGLGTQEFEVPDLIGKELDEVEFELLASNLQTGTIVYQADSDAPAGTVIKQQPEPEEMIRIGDMVDIWVAGQRPEPEEELSDLDSDDAE